MLVTTLGKFDVARIALGASAVAATMAEAALNKVWREALGPTEIDAAMAETEAATSSAEPAATSSAKPAAPSLPPPPGTNCQNLIKAALTDEPMLPEAVHAAMVEIAAGAYAVPPLKVVQTSLSARGENYAKKVTERGRTCWMKYPEGEGPEKLAPKKKKKPARPTKLTAKQMAAEAAKPFPKGGKAKEVVKLEKKVDFGALRRRSEDLISKPMSAFMLFGFSQRGALKTHGSTTVKEIVKAVGERWLLLGDEERAKYEVMAKEEVKYCERANARRAAEKEKAAKEALAFFDAKQAAKAKAAKEAMAAAAAAALAEQGPEDEDEEEDEVEEGGGVAEPDEGGVVEPDEDAVMEEADAGEAPVEEEGADDVLGEEDPSSFLPSPDGALGASPEGGVVLPSPEGAVGDFV